MYDAHPLDLEFVEMLKACEAALLREFSPSELAIIGHAIDVVLRTAGAMEEGNAA
jgi:hypothetical protein